MAYVEKVNPAVQSHESLRKGLRSVMFHLGMCRLQENREEFEQTLIRLGMPKEEAVAYYDVVYSSDPISPDSAKVFHSNTEFAKSFGILIDSLTLPRCWLLYRLCELVAPDEFRYEVSGTKHMGGTKSRKGSRWNPNNMAQDRRIVTIVRGPRDPETDNLIPVYKIFL